MAQIKDFLVNGRLQCGSDFHPPHLSRDTMYFLTTQNGFLVFGCKLCTELSRRPQIHVLSPGPATLQIYKRTRKAEHIDRDSRGKITSFR